MICLWQEWQIFLGALKSLQMVTVAMKLKMFAPWKESYDKPRQHIEKQRHHFANKGAYSQSCGFSSSHVWMWQLDHKEGCESESEVTQSCLPLCDPMDCSLRGSSVHGILQASILEWVAISFSRRSSQPRDRTRVFHIAGRRVYHLSHLGSS